MRPVAVADLYPVRNTRLPRSHRDRGVRNGVDRAAPVQEAFRQALDLCETAFVAYVGGTADQTPARFFVVLPTPGEWRGGERIVVCFASGRNGVELTSSVRGAASAPARR